jgi:hypothetical protein
MQAVAMTHVLLLLGAVAGVAGAAGFCGGVVLRRRRRKTRTVFTAGFLCGAAIAVIFDVRRRGVAALGTTMRRHVLPSSPPRASVEGSLRRLVTVVAVRTTSMLSAGK